MVNTGNGKSKEVCINLSKEYTSKRDELKKFLQKCNMYLTINEETYNTDAKNIAFILSYMSGGDVEAWALQFIDVATVREHYVSPP